jgi:hypothetical protein
MNVKNSYQRLFPPRRAPKCSCAPHFSFHPSAAFAALVPPPPPRDATACSRLRVRPCAITVGCHRLRSLPLASTPGAGSAVSCHFLPTPPPPPAAATTLRVVPPLARHRRCLIRGRAGPPVLPPPHPRAGITSHRRWPSGLCPEGFFFKFTLKVNKFG